MDLLKTQVTGAITDKLICSHSSKLKKDKAAGKKRTDADKLKAAEKEVVELVTVDNANEDSNKENGDGASANSGNGAD